MNKAIMLNCGLGIIGIILTTIYFFYMAFNNYTTPPAIITTPYIIIGILYPISFTKILYDFSNKKVKT